MPNIPLHISALFIATVFAIAFLIIISVYVCNAKRNLPEDERKRNFAVSVIILLVWLIFTLIVGISGFLNDYEASPPRILLVLLPPLLIIVMLFSAKGFHAAASPLDTFWFVYAQSFRVLTGFIFALLYRYKIIPVQMTFEGGNYDIIVGITAPLIAYYCFSKKLWPAWVALLWNFAGIIILIINISVALLSAPYPFRLFMSEPANTIMFYFPFVWIPAVTFPFALLLHLMAIRRLVISTSVVAYLAA